MVLWAALEKQSIVKKVGSYLDHCYLKDLSVSYLNFLAETNLKFDECSPSTFYMGMGKWGKKIATNPDLEEAAKQVLWFHGRRLEKTSTMVYEVGIYLDKCCQFDRPASYQNFLTENHHKESECPYATFENAVWTWGNNLTTNPDSEETAKKVTWFHGQRLEKATMKEEMEIYLENCFQRDVPASYRDFLSTTNHGEKECPKSKYNMGAQNWRTEISRFSDINELEKRISWFKGRPQKTYSFN